MDLSAQLHAPATLPGKEAQWFTAGLYVMVNLVSIKNLTPVRQYVGCHQQTCLDSSVTYVQFVQQKIKLLKRSQFEQKVEVM
jgi:hypothetical protein